MPGRKERKKVRERRHRKPTVEELAAHVELKKWDTLGKIIPAVAPWVGAMFIAGCTSFAIHDLAGKVTVANIKILAEAIMGEKEASLCPSWYILYSALIFGFFSVLLFKRERKEKKDAIERLHSYQSRWETSVDPSRTSSNLTPRGDTNPEDK